MIHSRTSKTSRERPAKCSARLEIRDGKICDDTANENKSTLIDIKKEIAHHQFSDNTGCGNLSQPNIPESSQLTAYAQSKMTGISKTALKCQGLHEKQVGDSRDFESDSAITTKTNIRYNAVLIRTSKNKQHSTSFTFSLYQSSGNEKNKFTSETQSELSYLSTKYKKVRKSALKNNDLCKGVSSLRVSNEMISNEYEVDSNEINGLLHGQVNQIINSPNLQLDDCSLNQSDTPKSYKGKERETKYNKIKCNKNNQEAVAKINEKGKCGVATTMHAYKTEPKESSGMKADQNSSNSTDFLKILYFNNTSEYLKSNSSVEKNVLLSTNHSLNDTKGDNDDKIETALQNRLEPNTPEESTSNESIPGSPQFSKAVKDDNPEIVVARIHGNGSDKLENIAETDAIFCKNSEPDEKATPKRKELKPLVHHLSHNEISKVNTKEILAKFNLGSAMTYALYGANDLTNKGDSNITTGKKDETASQKLDKRQMVESVTEIDRNHQSKLLNTIDGINEPCQNKISSTKNLTEKSASLIGGETEPFYIHTNSKNDADNSTIAQACNHRNCCLSRVQGNYYNQSALLGNAVGHCCSTDWPLSFPVSNYYPGDRQFLCPYHHHIPVLLTGFGMKVQPEMSQARFLPQSNFSRKIPNFYLTGNDASLNTYNLTPPITNLPALANVDDTAKGNNCQMHSFGENIFRNQNIVEETILSSFKHMQLETEPNKSFKAEGRKIAVNSSSGRNMAEVLYGKQTGSFMEPWNNVNDSQRI